MHHYLSSSWLKLRKSGFFALHCLGGLNVKLCESGYKRSLFLLLSILKMCFLSFSLSLFFFFVFYYLSWKSLNYTNNEHIMNPYVPIIQLQQSPSGAEFHLYPYSRPCLTLGICFRVVHLASWSGSLSRHRTQ